MVYKLSLYEPIKQYKEHLEATKSADKIKYLHNHVDTGFLRFVAHGMGFQCEGSLKKRTKQDTKRGWKFFQQQPLERLAEVEAALYRGLSSLNAPQASRNTYGAAVKGCLQWAKAEGFYPGSPKDELANQCAPPMLTGRGGVCSLRLTERRGRLPEYALREEELTPELRAEEAAFRAFYSGHCRPRNVVNFLESTSIDFYITIFRQCLGFIHHVLCPNGPIELLSFDRLMPSVSRAELHDLAHHDSEALWDSVIAYLDHWALAYKDYIGKECHSFSPNTWAGKEAALLALAKFQCQFLVRRRKDFGRLPLVCHIRDQLGATEIKREFWRSTRKSVSNQLDKWPDPVPGETALETLCKDVTDVLRLEARPRDCRQQIRSGRAIATAIFLFLLWYFFTRLPPTRQSNYRETKIALSCPRQRPAEVPPHGLYLPPLAVEYRDKLRDGQLGDNFLYRVYQHEGTNYPEGIYVLEFNKYKTKKYYGKQTFVLTNCQFPDGTTLYNYMDWLLFGRWVQTKSTKASIYRGGQSEFQGKRMLLVTRGRMEFNPQDHQPPLPPEYRQPLPHEEQPLPDDRGTHYLWGYWWIQPRAGHQFGASQLTRTFETPAHRLIGKRPTLHTLRYIWASWAFVKELTMAQMESLAYMMGTSVAMLGQMYDHRPHQEKTLPIEKAIEAILIRDLEGASVGVQELCLSEVLASAQQLSAADQQQLVLQLLQAASLAA